MKIPDWINWRIIPFMLLCGLTAELHADVPNPTGTNAWLNAWSFDDTNYWTSDYGYAPISYTNLGSYEANGLLSLVVDSTNNAWLQFNVYESDGTTNLMVDVGSLYFWFAPDWLPTNHGGTGPGQSGRLIEVGSYTTNNSYQWWSLYFDPGGTNIYFSAQTNGFLTNYITCPINWTNNNWHFIALTYSSSNSALYLDGLLATNGPGVSRYPSTNVLAKGFFIGSDANTNGNGNGIAQARGMFADLYTYNYPLSSTDVGNEYLLYSILWTPLVWTDISSGSSTNTVTPTFNAVTGSGNLVAGGTNSATCVTSTNIWFTNVVVTTLTNGTRLTFSIAGGSDGVLYDVFANSVLAAVADTNRPWSWMGQAYHCVTNSLTITNQPNISAFLVLGQPGDADGDGLTDAYELLVSKSDPHNATTSGDGMLDGWAVMWGLDPRVAYSPQPSARGNFNYDPAGRLKQETGLRIETLGFDGEGNIQQDSQ